MRISIFGMGYVGTVSGACLAKLGHDVIGVDVNPGKIAALNAGRAPLVEPGIDELIAEAAQAGRLSATDNADEAVAGSDLSLISVGTPSAKGGGQDLAILDQVVAAIGRAVARKDGSHCLVLRSTVLPGITEERVLPALTAASGRQPGQGLEVAFNPEFLREGAAIQDFFSPPFTVIGSLRDEGIQAVEALYKDLKAPYHRTTPRVAESIKYISNSYHALKITFANEIGTLLKSLDIDSREAMEIFMADRQLNISPAYLRPGFAFGGSCLPKELRAISYLAGRQALELPMLGQLLESNRRHVERVREMVLRRGRRKVAFFGLAFKPKTDDLRESPLVTLAEQLLGKGLDLAIYDPAIQVGRLTGSNREYIEQEIPHLDRLMTESPEEALDGAETIVVGHAPAEVLAAIAQVAPGRAVIDLQGVAELQALDEVDYEGVCW